MRPAHGTAVALLLSLAIWSAASLAIPGVRRPVLHALQSLSIHRTQVQAQLTPYP